MKSLTVDGTLKSLKTIAQYTIASATEAGLDRSAAYKLRLAMDEIATNIITHGYQEAGLTGKIRLQAHIDDRSLTITIEDMGAKYNPQERLVASQELLETPMAERPIGGLGVYLALMGVDGYSYQRVGNRNRNTFVMYRRVAASNC